MASQWEELEKWMQGQQLPKGFDLFRNPDWVENYVRSLVTKSLPSAAASLGTGLADIKETKRSLVITYPLGEEADLTKLRVLIREDKLRIAGMAEGKGETITLPKLVVPSKSSVHYEGASLVVKIMKRQPRRRVHEAEIRRIWQGEE
ncbi:hypothetical protein FHS18_006529 [Paenibacillus phyllosphaerae]|uniref:Molecular chaperone IbpA, HSP20 family n=1 Tax=Paenibacillus phyllosphaerae TaxID=274593 RepID=A0A7W5B4U1_9BACL|nr:hypothetical protein [Paenibacillus phyllosphaerae]MBB3114408.1 hypothetical protein [Paenibacillus phyllosphaerae]